MKGPFEELVEPHRARLRLHCYRMLGSSSDAEDMAQETLTRAFRSRHTLEDDALVRPWLYRIATNVCLDELQARGRRARGTEPELGPPSDPDVPPAASTPASEWLEPCPSSWLAGADPAAAYTVKESVALAFVAALQVLSARERAVLLLRDVVGLTAEETAAALETTVPAANSALHRARAALATRVGPRSEWSPDASAPVDRALLERYLRAWEASDLGEIISLLHDEVVLSMPPHPTWFAGKAAVARFFTNRVRQAVVERRFRTAPFEANGRPAVAFYRREGDRAVFFALQILEIHPGGVRAIDHFMASVVPRAMFDAGLAETL